MGYSDKDQVMYRVWAFLTPTQTIDKHGVFMRMHTIYISSPAGARYAVVTDETDEIRVIDIYETPIGPDADGWHMPASFVPMRFKNIEHALAATRINYDHSMTLMHDVSYERSGVFWKQYLSITDKPKERK